MENRLRKRLAVAVILLFIVVLFAPGINANVNPDDNVKKPNVNDNKINIIGNIELIPSDSFSYEDCVVVENNQNHIVPFDAEYDPGYLPNPMFDIYDLDDETDQTTYGLTAADFNDDGNIDFAVSNATDPHTRAMIHIYYNDGEGEFTSEEVYKTGAYLRYIDSLDSSDFDNDGDIDLIFGYSEFIWYQGLPVKVYGIINILYNDGENNFGNETIIITRGSGIPYDPEGRHNPHMSSSDYDKDGDIDLLVGDNSGKIEFYLNNGSGNFTSAGIIHDFGRCSWGVTSGDFDGDGYIDFIVAAVADETLGYIYLKLNNRLPTCFDLGAGTIIAEIFSYPGTASLEAFDYNNDGAMDFIAGLGRFPYLCINREFGNDFDFFKICTLPDGLEGYLDSTTFGGLTSADFDKDGFADIVIGGTQGYVRLFINKHCLAVITRPKNTYYYKFDEEQFQQFPYNGILCIGKTTVEATELEEIEKVEFYVDRWLLETDTTPPYDFSWTWRPFLLFRFRHTLKIVAYDSDGNHSSEDEIFPAWRFL